MIIFDGFGKFREKKADLQEVREGLVKSGTCNRLDRCRCSPSLVVTVILPCPPGQPASPGWGLAWGKEMGS